MAACSCWSGPALCEWCVTALSSRHRRWISPAMWVHRMKRVCCAWRSTPILPNGYVYIDYTDDKWAVQVIRYQFADDDPDRLDPSSAHTILTVPKQSKYHNGGTLAFGPDGYLYVSVGDAEQSSAAQEVSNPYGKILRIDVTGGDPYAITPSNPF